jgi:hypothetical protein
MAAKEPWLLSEQRWLEANYYSLSDQQLADELGRTKSSVRGKLQDMELRGKRSPAIYQQGRFKKGEPGRGKRGGRKGAPDGEERKFRNGSARRIYTFEKVNGKWVRQQLLRWVALHGSIPANHLLICRTADTANSDPSNWELITRAEQVRRNHKPEQMRESLRELWVVARALKADGKQHNSGIGRRLAAVKQAA